MILFPAIDILNNQAVRLLYGDKNQVTIYGSPLEMAEKWVAQGAEFLHIVDLNAAFDDDSTNEKTIKELASKIGVPIQIGGGMRTMQKATRYLDKFGVNRIIVGTAAVTDEAFFEKVTKSFGSRIVSGIDVRDGKVAIKGWVDSVNISAKELALRARDSGVTTVVYTDISRDGALCGVNVEGTMRLSIETQMNVIASGGVKDINDVKRLTFAKTYGAILGKSLYEHTLDFTEAVAFVKVENSKK